MQININLSNIQTNHSSPNIKPAADEVNKILNKSASGQILDITNKEITIEMADSTILKGEFDNIGQVAIGDIIVFTPIQNPDGSIHVELAKHNNNMPNQTILNLLNEYGLNGSEENIDIIKNLIENNLPVTKDNIQTLNQALKLLGKENIKEALFLIENNMPLNKNSADMVMDFSNNKVNITNQLNNLFENINSMEDIFLKSEILQLFSNEEMTLLSSDKHALNDDEPLTTDDYKVNDKMNLKNMLPEKELITTKELLKSFDNIQSFLEKSVQDSNQLVSKEQIKNMADFIKSNFNENDDIDKGNILNMLKDKFPNESVDFLNKLFKVNDNNKLKNLADEKSKIILKDNKISFSMEDSKPEDIDEFFKEVSEKLAMVKDLVPKDSNSFKDIQKSCDDIKQSINFFNDTNEMMFLHLPINFNDNVQNAELFVFKDKKKKKSNNNIASALISLDTVNFGKLESYIQKNNKSINIQFRVKDDNATKTVKDNINKLNTMLREIDYSLDNYSFVSSKELFNIVSDTPTTSQPVEKSKEKSALEKISFDIRA